MSTAIIHPIANQTAQYTNNRSGPPSRADDALSDAQREPVAARDGADGSEGAADGAADAVDGAQHAGMRRAVVQQDDAGGEREGAGRDLEEEHDGDAGPDEDAGRLALGRGGGQEGEVGREEIGDREEGEEGAERAHQTEARGHGWVEHELEANADDAEDGHGEADRGRRECETAFEGEGRDGCGVVSAWRGEEGDPEGGEGTEERKLARMRIV